MKGEDMRNPLVFLVMGLLAFAAVGCMSYNKPMSRDMQYYGDYADSGWGDEEALYESADYEYNQFAGLTPEEISIASSERRRAYESEKSSGRSMLKTKGTPPGAVSSDSNSPYNDEFSNEILTDDEVEEQTAKAQLVSGEEIQQKLIYTGAFTIGVYDIELKKKELLKKVNELGGYLQSETNTQLEVRVPAEKFFEVVKIIEDKKIGRVLNKYVVTKDVTEKFYDIQKRLEVKKDALETLKEILKKTEKIEDVIALQREIRTLIEEIETLEGSMRVLQSLIRHSLITIDFRLEQDISKSGQSNKVRLPIPWLARHSLEQLLGLRLQQYQYTR